MGLPQRPPSRFLVKVVAEDTGPKLQAPSQLKQDLPLCPCPRAGVWPLEREFGQNYKGPELLLVGFRCLVMGSFSGSGFVWGL